MSESSRWAPFRVNTGGAHGDSPRAIVTREGVGDRLRAAAFAELQAREAFLWAADHFAEAPEDAKRCWRALADAEDRHLGWLLDRLAALGLGITDRAVSDLLWISLTTCSSASEFAHFMAGAEDRGRKAGERFHAQLVNQDPISAEIFRKIAEEEIAHIESAERYFPKGSATSPSFRTL